MANAGGFPQRNGELPNAVPASSPAAQGPTPTRQNLVNNKSSGPPFSSGQCQRSTGVRTRRYIVYVLKSLLNREKVDTELSAGGKLWGSEGSGSPSVNFMDYEEVATAADYSKKNILGDAYWPIVSSANKSLFIRKIKLRFVSRMVAEGTKIKGMAPSSFSNQRARWSTRRQGSFRHGWGSAGGPDVPG